MIVLYVLPAFVIGLLIGLLLRPSLDRRRQQLRSKARFLLSISDASDIATQSEFSLPPDYYHSDRRQPGTLSEGFGLRRRATDHADAAQTELDLSASMPRDYYDRQTPDDEGTLSESYGLRKRSASGDTAA